MLHLPFLSSFSTDNPILLNPLHQVQVARTHSSGMPAAAVVAGFVGSAAAGAELKDWCCLDPRGLEELGLRRFAVEVLERVGDWFEVAYENFGYGSGAVIESAVAENAEFDVDVDVGAGIG